MEIVTGPHFCERLHVARFYLFLSCRFQIMKVDRPLDGLPTAQTCFFQLRLPPYTSRAVMEERLTYAIRHCRWEIYHLSFSSLNTTLSTYIYSSLSKPFSKIFSQHCFITCTRTIDADNYMLTRNNGSRSNSVQGGGGVNLTNIIEN